MTAKHCLIRRSGRIPIVLAVAAAVILLGGVGVVTFSKMTSGGAGAHAGKNQKPKNLYPWKLEEFVVNLADQAEPHYLKISMVLEVAAEPAKGGGHGESEGGENVKDAKARDAIIEVLSAHSYVELLAADGKERLKAELKQRLEQVLEDTEVANIYFTAFAIQ